jgi:hypothetical protein
MATCCSCFLCECNQQSVASPATVAGTGQSSSSVVGDISNIGSVVGSLTTAASGVVALVKQAQKPVAAPVSWTTLALIGGAIVIVYIIVKK